MYLAEAGLLDINASFLIEVAVFLIMLAILAKWVWPPLRKVAEARQRLIEEQITKAEEARREAEEHLKQAAERLEDARKQAQEVIAGASRAAEQVREELKEKGEAEAKRLVEAARRDIEAARRAALESVRSEVGDMVIEATRKVVGEALDVRAHKKLIDEAIREVAAGGRSS